MWNFLGNNGNYFLNGKGFLVISLPTGVRERVWESVVSRPCVQTSALPLLPQEAWVSSDSPF